MITEIYPAALQHVNVKIFALKANIALVDAIPVFHRWIQDKVVPELVIDVADYKHVPDGPGIMLIGHEADYSLDETDGKLGMLYNRKSGVDGDAQAALYQAYSSALTATELLESDPAFAGKLTFDRNNIEVLINDRMIASNNGEAWTRFYPEIKQFFSGVYGSNDFSITQVGEPRDRFRVRITR